MPTRIKNLPQISETSQEFKKVLFMCNRADFDARELLHGVTSEPLTAGWILRVHAWPQSHHQWREWIDGFQPDGIIVFSPLSPEIHADLIAEAPPHVFLTWGDVPFQKHDCLILPDEEAVGKLAAEHLIERKFQHFAVVSYMVIAHMIKRKSGFMNVFGETRTKVHVYDADLGERPLKPYGEHIPEDFYAWIADLPKPCALFACDDEIGVVVIEACRHLNINVPKDIAVLGAGNDGQACRIIAPRLSSVSVPFVDIGRRSAEVLNLWMNGTPPEKGVEYFGPKEVVVRSSTDILDTKDPIVGKALDYIAANFNKHMRVSDLQRHTGVSAKTLETRFKNELRRTPVEEVRRYRIEHAKSLLQETELSVNEIAAKCGFKQAHKFSTVFRELAGCRPSDYRRLYKGTH